MPRAMQWFRGKPKPPPKDLVGAELQEIAKRILNQFESGQRNDGSEFISFKDGTPEWMINIVHEAHGDMMPDDYKYRFSHDAIDWIAEGNDPESPNIEADPYTGELIKWLGSHVGDRPNYVDEAVEEYGHSDQGLVGDLMSGQAKEKDEVYHIVLQELQKIQEGS